LGTAVVYLAAGAPSAIAVVGLTVPVLILARTLVASERRAALLSEAAMTTLRHGLAESERERERWARDLHDETIQALGALRLHLASAAAEAQAEQLRTALAE